MDKKIPTKGKTTDIISTRSENSEKNLKWIAKGKEKMQDSLVVQAALKVQKGPKVWILDSGCSSHMSGDKSLFSELVSYDGGTVKFGNNENAAIIGKGNVDAGAGRIQNVLYVEGLKHSLLSVSQIYDMGYTVTFKKNGVEIRETCKGKIVAGGTRTSGNLYTLAALSLEQCMNVNEEQDWLWHKRLGHIGFENLAKLCRKNAVRNLPNIKVPRNHICEACQKGKQIRTRYSEKEHNSRSPLDIIHIDLYGPTQNKGFNGERYFMVMVDITQD